MQPEVGTIVTCCGYVSEIVKVDIRPNYNPLYHIRVEEKLPSCEYRQFKILFYIPAKGKVAKFFRDEFEILPTIFRHYMDLNKFATDAAYAAEQFIIKDAKNHWTEAGTNRALAGLNEKAYESFSIANHYYMFSMFLVMVRLKMDMYKYTDWRQAVSEENMNCMIKNLTCQKQDVMCLLKEYKIDLAL